MDGQRFDEFAKTLATTRSRRGVLKALGGLSGGLAAALLGQSVAEASHSRAHCKEPGRPCAFNTNCCSQTCCNKVCCAAGQVCQNGECVEPAPTCTGTCFPGMIPCPSGCVCTFTGFGYTCTAAP